MKTKVTLLLGIFIAILLVCSCSNKENDTPDSTGRILGTITDTEGQPINGASVSITDGTTITTGADGHYVFDNLKVGRQYTVQATHSDHLADRKLIHVEKNTEYNGDIALKSKFGRIYGLVKDSKTDAPVQNVTVSLLPGGETASTGNTGYYDFNRLTPGSYTIEVNKSGYRNNRLIVDVVAGVTTRGDISITQGSAYLSVDKPTVEFGTNTSVAAFVISNIGASNISWKITQTSEWISKIEPAMGMTQANGKSTVTVYIDRNKITGSQQYSTNLIIDYDDDYVDVTVSVNGSGTPGGIAVTNSLMAYYTFDDEKGTNSIPDYGIPSAVFTGDMALTDATPNGKGKAVSINGTGAQYLKIPSDFLNKKENLLAYSISFWANGFGNGMLMSAMDDGNDIINKYPRLTCDSKKLIYTADYSTIHQLTFATQSFVRENTWHHIMITCSRILEKSEIDPSDITVSLYFDGVLVETKIVNGMYIGNSQINRIQFGGTAHSTITATAFKADNIRLYNRVLSGDEVMLIYNSEK